MKLQIKRQRGGQAECKRQKERKEGCVGQRWSQEEEKPQNVRETREKAVEKKYLCLRETGGLISEQAAADPLHFVRYGLTPWRQGQSWGSSRRVVEGGRL